MEVRNMKIYRCPICGNIVMKLEDFSEALVCCGKAMELLVPNESDGAKEKHLPVYEMTDSEIKVTVGEVTHPMEEAHSIKWILVEREDGFSMKHLNPTDNPSATFVNYNDAKAIYSYCNLHGLYKTVIK